MVVQQRAPRLPSSGSARSRGAEIGLGLAGALSVVLLVVGVPLALSSAFGSPWPDSGLNRQFLTAELSTDAVLSIVAALVWLAWLHFCLCLVVEVVAERRGQGLAPRIPGGAVGTQALARRLVAAVLLLAGSATVTVGSASAAVSDPGRTGLASPSVGHSSSSERKGAPDADPAAIVGGRASPRSTALGQKVVRTPHLAVKYYQVQPPKSRNYDTLWDIAERFLGNGLRYKELFELNKGVPQPDGRILERADLIHPGWVLRMPADAHGPGLTVGKESADAQPSNVPDAAPQITPAVQPSTFGVVDGAGMPGPEPSADVVTEGADWSPTFGVAGGLVAAGLLVGLRRSRSSKPGTSLGQHDDVASTGAELALRGEADLPAAAMLDRALRSWASADGARVPSPAQLSVSPNGIAVSFAQTPSMTAPAPWESQREGRVWMLRRRAVRRLAVDENALCPVPALVTFGRRDDGSLLLLDLEAVPGVVSIGGDGQVARALAMSWVVDLCAHVWADDRRVTLVGFADDVTAIGRGRARVVDDIERVIEELDVVATHQSQGCQRLGADSVRSARGMEPDARRWATELVVCSGVPRTPVLERLSGLAAADEHAISVVVIGDVTTAAARLVASTEGRLWCGPLGVDVVAQQITVQAYRGLIDLFAADASRALVDVGPDLFTDGLPTPELAAGVLDLAVRQPVEIGILGDVAVESDGPVEEARRDLLTEIVVYVALHPEGVHPATLSGAVWPRGVSEDIRDTALRQAQQWLGENDTGEPRLAQTDGLWNLGRSGVRFDWDVFRTYVNAAARAGSEPGPALRDALAVVRGEPWANLPAGQYSWLAYDSVDNDARAAVVLVARRLSALCVESGDAQGAREALVRGLAVAPAAEDLWCDSLRLAQQLGSAAELRQVADHLYSAIGRHGSPSGATATTDALVSELIPGYRRSAA